MSDIDAAADSLKVLDPKWPIREADIDQAALGRTPGAANEQKARRGQGKTRGSVGYNLEPRLAQRAGLFEDADTRAALSTNPRPCKCVC